MHRSKTTTHANALRSGRRRLSRRLLVPIVALLGTAGSLAMAAAPASAITRCATDYKVVSVSIKYKACAANVRSGTIKVYGQILNDHGSAILVWYKLGYRDLTANSITWYAPVIGPQLFQAHGPWTTPSSRNFGCTPGHAVRGLMQASANGVWGPVSESNTITC